MRRALPDKLGRPKEALISAWAGFPSDPGTFTCRKLLRQAPEAKRRPWHEKAMKAAGQGALDSLTDLWLHVKETARLADRLGRASDAELEGLSH